MSPNGTGFDDAHLRRRAERLRRLSRRFAPAAYATVGWAIGLAAWLLCLAVHADTLVLAAYLFVFTGLATALRAASLRHTAAALFGLSQIALVVGLATLVAALRLRLDQALPHILLPAAVYLAATAVWLRRIWASVRVMPAGLCETCGYPLFGLSTPRCPECGQPFNPDKVPPTPQEPWQA